MEKKKAFRLVLVVAMLLILNVLVGACFWEVLVRVNRRLLPAGIVFLAATILAEGRFFYLQLHMDYEKEALEEKERLQNEYHREMEKEQRDLEELEKNVARYMRHIAELLERREVEATRDYAQNILDECHKKEWVKLCNHPLLDAVLHAKQQICEEQEIVFEAAAYVPEDIFCTDAEMISIFHNLLDNAIEACMRMKQGEERRISFRTGVKNGQFVLSCVNTRRKNETILGKTWKKDPSLHGLGQKIVEDIVCEHKGNCVCDTKPDSWSVIITLALENESA